MFAAKPRRKGYKGKPIPNTMARPIEPTPTLEGIDVENFYRELERPKTTKEIEQRRKMFAEADYIFKKFGGKFIRKMVA